MFIREMTHAARIKLPTGTVLGSVSTSTKSVYRAMWGLLNGVF